MKNLFTDSNYLLMDLAEDLTSMGGASEETEEEKNIRLAEETKEDEDLTPEQLAVKKIEDEANEGLTPEQIESKRIEKENEGLTPEEIEAKRIADEKTESELNFVDDEEEPGSETENLLLGSATELGFELPEGEESWTQNSFTTAVKSEIEESKQKLNLDEFDPEVQTIIDYVNNNDGSLGALAMDSTIRRLNEISFMDSESFFEYMYALDVDPAGTMEKDALQAQVDQRIENIPEADRDEFFDKFKNDTIKSRFKPAIDDRIEAINKEKSDFRERQVAIGEKAHNSKKLKMINIVDNMTNIAGLAINDKTKSFLKKNIENENLFQEHNKNEAEYQLLGFLFKKFGPKIAEMYGSVITDQENSVYTKGVMEGLSKGYGNAKKSTKGPGKTGPSAGAGNVTVNNWAAFNSVGKE